MSWQPIETAPKDGTSIITIVPGFEPCISEWRSIGETSRFCQDPETFMCKSHFLEYFHELEYFPVYWMPLDALPEIPK